MAHMLQIRLHAYHPVIREGQFVLTCGGGAGIEPVEEEKKIKCCDVDNCECYRSCYYYLLNT